MGDMNIMTSSDSGLMPYISIQMQSISDSIKNRHVNFFLLHDGIDDVAISKLQRQCDEYSNISFHSIAVKDDGYDKIARVGGGWPETAYFPILAHLYLPEDLDRVLYIDAGDTFFAGDPKDYYDADFNGNALTVTPASFKDQEGELVLYEEKDLNEEKSLKEIVRGVFNSGAYVINLKYMREQGYSMDDYVGFAEVLSKAIIMENGGAYWGDQGLLSATFVGNLQGYGYPRIKDIRYMPNNFCLGYFNTTSQKPGYIPNIIHFAGSEKPWRMKYPISLKILGDKKESELISMDSLKMGQAEYYYLWHETAIKTQWLLDRIGVV